MRQAEHDHVEGVITRYVRGLRRALRRGDDAQVAAAFESAYTELRRSTPLLAERGEALPSLATLLDVVADHLPQHESRSTRVRGLPSTDPPSTSWSAVTSWAGA
jgi:hypothetical protein